MAIPKCSQEEFILLCRSNSPAQVSKILKCSYRAVLARRESLQNKIGQILKPEIQTNIKEHSEYPLRHSLEVQDGVIIIGSDAHYWPNKISTAHKAFVHFCKIMNPEVVIMNGDLVDGARISRHPPLGWKRLPTVKEELDSVEERISEIEEASKKAKHLWTFGNHDSRFEMKLASQVGEFAEVQGFSLRDHFPAWHMAMSFWINDDLIVKHRFKGGVHATHNNTQTSGKSMATGHLHSLKVTPYSDYNGTRYGIDTGTLADPYGEQFEYAEDSPLNHRSGFIVITIKDGMMLWPEIVSVVEEGTVQFRATLIDV